MIQANELRIGNYLKASEPEHNGKYFPIDIGDIKEIREGMKRYKYESIPLTAEILKKCGFKYNKLDGVARLGDDIEECKGDTEFWEFGKMTIVSWDKGPLTLSNKSSFDHRIELTSLHQLQNVVFFLTGEELTINL